jgi:hypothetical protein
MGHIENIIVIFIYENSELLIPKVLQNFAESQAVRFFFKCYIYFVFPEELPKNTTRWHPMKIKNKTSGPNIRFLWVVPCTN